MKTLKEFITESRIRPEDTVILTKDFEFCTISEYEDAPEEFEDEEAIAKMMEFAKETRGWTNRDSFIIPKNTKIEYLQDDNFGRAQFKIIDGPAEGLQFRVFSELLDDMKFRK